jgi:hypothetical protein
MTKTAPKQIAHTAVPTQAIGTATREVRRDQRDTCHRDRLGRVIGGRASTWSAWYELTGEPERADGRCWYLPEGQVWAFCPHATRDGIVYGASQSDQFYATEAERDAAVELYFVGMEKRAAKTAASVESEKARWAAKRR